eukprot:3443611-Rhodomonas_salina.1
MFAPLSPAGSPLAPWLAGSPFSPPVLTPSARAFSPSGTRSHLIPVSSSSFPPTSSSLSPV